MFVQILVSAKTRGAADGGVWLQAERRTSQAPWRRHAHIRTCARRGCLGPSRCSGSCGVVASRTACSSGKSWQGRCARESARGQGPQAPAPQQCSAGYSPRRTCTRRRARRVPAPTPTAHGNLAQTRSSGASGSSSRHPPFATSTRGRSLLAKGASAQVESMRKKKSQHCRRHRSPRGRWCIANNSAAAACLDDKRFTLRNSCLCIA